MESLHLHGFDHNRENKEIQGSHSRMVIKTDAHPWRSTEIIQQTLTCKPCHTNGPRLPHQPGGHVGVMHLKSFCATSPPSRNIQRPCLVDQHLQVEQYLLAHPWSMCCYGQSCLLRCELRHWPQNCHRRQVAHLASYPWVENKWQRHRMGWSHWLWTSYLHSHHRESIQH